MTDEAITPEVNVEELQLDDVVNMDPADLTDTHREYLDTNKSQLTTDQQAKFFSEGEKEPEEKPEEKKESGFDPNTAEPVLKNPIKLEIDDTGDDDDMDSEDRARINKQVAKGSKGIIQRQQLIEDTQAINSIVADNQELKEFKGLALKYMKAHPTLIATDAMKIASAGHQQRIGAIKERETAEKVRKTQSGGSSFRSSGGGAKDWGRATDAEMEAQIAAAKGQRI